MILEVQPGYGLFTGAAFEFISVYRTHYANADFNNHFITRNRFNKAQVA